MPSPSQGKRISSMSVGRHSAAALRRGEVKISDPIPLPRDTVVDDALQPDHDIFKQQVVTSTADGTWPRRSTPPEAGAWPRSGSGQRRPSQLAINRESAGHSAIISTMSSKNSLKQRKSGGFRATIRSLFGSKRHRSSLSNDRSYHISDPGNLVPIREKPIDRHVTRTPSQTISGVTQASPLGSHSPFTRLDSKRARSADRAATLPGHKRRNTMSSIVFSDQDTQQINNEVDRTSDRAPIELISSSEQPYQMPKSLKRRSRSADALTELVVSQVQSPATWRKSLLDQPLPTFDTKGGSAAKKTTAGTPTTQYSRLNSTASSNSLKPIQAFDFGLLADVSLEDRIKTLELKCHNFEFAIAGLQGCDVGTPVHTSRPPKRRSIHDLFVETTAPPTNRATPGQGLTFLKSPTDSASPSDEDRRQTQRSSATTIRPAKPNASPPQRSAAPSPSTISQKGDNLSNLLVMFEEERAARMQLEAQVLELQKLITAYAISQPNLYATPSPESLYTDANDNRARPLHRTPAFPRRSRNNLAETSRFSISDTEESDTEGGSYHDVYETPQKSKYAFKAAEISPRPTVEIF